MEIIGNQLEICTHGKLVAPVAIQSPPTCMMAA